MRIKCNNSNKNKEIMELLEKVNILNLQVIDNKSNSSMNRIIKILYDQVYTECIRIGNQFTM